MWMKQCISGEPAKVELDMNYLQKKKKEKRPTVKMSIHMTLFKIGANVSFVERWVENLSLFVFTAAISDLIES